VFASGFKIQKNIFAVSYHRGSAPITLRRRNVLWGIPFALPVALQTSLITAAKDTVIPKYKARTEDYLKS
jgi:hypothetical protein